MKTTTEAAAQIEHLKREASQHKHMLMDIERKMRELSPKKASSLGSIIGRLEQWQITK